MKKALLFPVCILIAVAFVGAYGILHDLLTYNISPEYYTRFKFIQFGLGGVEWHLLGPSGELQLNYPYLGVALVGFLATWWAGALGGTVLAAFTLSMVQSMRVLPLFVKALGAAILVSFIVGLFGLVTGWLLPLQNSIPLGVTDLRSFQMVGFMHTFGYIGIIPGIATGVFYIFRQKKKVKGPVQDLTTV